MNEVLKYQGQWVTGKPQISNASRVCYDFSDSDKISPILKIGVMPYLRESDGDAQDASICEPEESQWVLFFSGDDIVDRFQNKLNPFPLNAARDFPFSSIITPNNSGLYGPHAYNIFYIEAETLSLCYAVVNYEFGYKHAAKWVGIVRLGTVPSVSPLSVATISADEYWLLLLDNTNTLAALQFKGEIQGKSFEYYPLISDGEPSADLSESSILVHGTHIAVTIQQRILVGKITLSPGFDVPVLDQAIVTETFSGLMPAFNASGNALYYLEPGDADSTDTTKVKNHVWVFQNGANYSANTNHVYSHGYKTLKLGPDNIIYGTTNEFDSLLVVSELDDSAHTTLIFEVSGGGALTFGNNQIEFSV